MQGNKVRDSNLRSLHPPSHTGRPMKIELAASSISQVTVTRAPAAGATRGGGGGSGRGGRGGGRGGGAARQPKKPVTQEELDADLDAFVSKA